MPTMARLQVTNEEIDDDATTAGGSDDEGKSGNAAASGDGGDDELGDEMMAEWGDELAKSKLAADDLRLAIIHNKERAAAKKKANKKKKVVQVDLQLRIRPCDDLRSMEAATTKDRAISVDCNNSADQQPDMSIKTALELAHDDGHLIGVPKSVGFVKASGLRAITQIIRRPSTTDDVTGIDKWAGVRPHIPLIGP